MPSKSKNQQRAAAMAMAAHKGLLKKSELRGAALQMYNSMSMSELEMFAKTKRKGLPRKVKRNK